jgi:3',5'-cyclic AMP phosphodiesterase CpdA
MGNHDARTSRPSFWPEKYWNNLPALSADNQVVSAHPPYYYSFDVANVHFICLYTQASDLGDSLIHGLFAYRDQIDWLAYDLASTTRPWKVAFFHNPMFTNTPDSTGTGTNMYDMQRTFPWEIAKVLRNHQVQLAFSGHRHTYERHDRRDPLTYTRSDTGTVTVISGAGSDNSSGFSTLLTEVWDDTMQFRCVDTAGDTIDSWQLPLTGQPQTGTTGIVIGPGSSADAQKKQDLVASPNPFNQAITITLVRVDKIDIAQPSLISIYAINGKLIKREAVTCGTLMKSYKWEVGSRPPGIYLIKIDIRDRKYLKKVLYQR